VSCYDSEIDDVWVLYGRKIRRKEKKFSGSLAYIVVRASDCATFA